MSKIPFAIVGSNTAVKTRDGRIVRAREYPWGVIEVDNEEHCDFVKLRQMLIRYFPPIPPLGRHRPHGGLPGLRDLEDCLITWGFCTLTLVYLSLVSFGVHFVGDFMVICLL